MTASGSPFAGKAIEVFIENHTARHCRRSHCSIRRRFQQNLLTSTGRRYTKDLWDHNEVIINYGTVQVYSARRVQDISNTSYPRRSPGIHFPLPTTTRCLSALTWAWMRTGEIRISFIRTSNQDLSPICLFRFIDSSVPFVKSQRIEENTKTTSSPPKAYGLLTIKMCTFRISLQ